MGQSWGSPAPVLGLAMIAAGTGSPAFDQQTSLETAWIASVILVWSGEVKLEARRMSCSNRR